MGEIAGRLADVVIITTDNSRREATLSILVGIEGGLLVAGRSHVPNRRVGDVLGWGGAGVGVGACDWHGAAA